MKNNKIIRRLAAAMSVVTLASVGVIGVTYAQENEKQVQEKQEKEKQVKQEKEKQVKQEKQEKQDKEKQEKQDKEKQDKEKQEKEKSHLEVKADDLKKEIDANKNKQNEIKKQIEQAQKEYNELDKKQLKNKINFFGKGEEYVKLLAQYNNDSFSGNQPKAKEDTEKIIKLVGETEKNKKDGWIEKHQFISTPGDKDRKIKDLNNLTPEEKLEVNLFAADLINQIRKSFGTKEVTVSKNAMELADEIAAKYKERKWDVFGKDKGHYCKGINDVAKEHDLLTPPKENYNKYQYLENKYAYSYIKFQNMDELKKYIYESIVCFMFNTKEYDHAKSIAGLHLWDSDDVDYFGLGFSQYTVNNFLTTNFHFIKYSPSKMLKDTITKNDKTYDIPHIKDADLTKAKDKVQELTKNEKALGALLDNQQNEYNKIINEIKKVNDDKQSTEETTKPGSDLENNNEKPIITNNSESKKDEQKQEQKQGTKQGTKQEAQEVSNMPSTGIASASMAIAALSAAGVIVSRKRK